MHEFSAASQMVDILLSEAAKRKVKRVIEVRVIIGKLTFLNPEQVRFAYEVLSEGTVLQGSRLIIEEKEGLAECVKCGYRGGLETGDDVYAHIGLPLFRCPKCGGELKIIEGREFTVKSMKVEA